jgi:hypothetical protein
MILFKARTTFAEVKAKKNCMEVQIVFPKHVANRRFTRISVPWAGCYVHAFELNELEQLDDQVARWLKEAYELKHAKTRRQAVRAGTETLDRVDEIRSAQATLLLFELRQPASGSPSGISWDCP